MEMLVRYLEENVGEPISPRELGALVPHLQDWQREFRSYAKRNGIDYIYDNHLKKYILRSLERLEVEVVDNRSISARMRAMIIARDNSTCKMCGRNVAQHNITIHIDHIVPYDWGGATTMDNLQCLCSICNQGKKAWIASEDPFLMARIYQAPNARERLRLFFEYYPNQELDVDRLSTIAHTRDWTKEVRNLRNIEGMNIVSLPRQRGVRDISAYMYITT